MLGWYQTIGGSIGVILTVYAILVTESYMGITLLIYAFALLLFSYSIFCGVICVGNKESSLRHSLINQLIQCLGFAFLGFAFSYAAGFISECGNRSF